MSGVSGSTALFRKACSSLPASSGGFGALLKPCSCSGLHRQSRWRSDSFDNSSQQGSCSSVEEEDGEDKPDPYDTGSKQVSR